MATSLYLDSQPFLISQHPTNTGMCFNTFVAADHNINLIYFIIDIRLLMLISQAVVLCKFFKETYELFSELVKKKKE